MQVEISEFLEQFRGQTVHVFINTGNAGDSLIGAGTFQLLDRAGIRVIEPMANGFDARGKTIFYGGGGNLVGDSTDSYRVISRAHREAKRLVILPHTIRRVDSLLDEFGANVTVIARERTTFAYVSERKRNYEALLAHDLALSLDVRVLQRKKLGLVPFWMPAWYAVNKVSGRRAVPRIRGMWRSFWRRDLASAVPGSPSGGALDAFRIDGESAGNPLPEGNIDLSEVFALGTIPRAMGEMAAQRFVNAIDQFDTIRTDRLHVGIGAALLGKRVELHANNYYKIRAVYDFSMRERFPNVIWMT